MAKTIILKDNQTIPNREQEQQPNEDKIFPLNRKERDLFRYLSDHSLLDLRDENDNSVLVFSQSFDETQDGFGDSYVLHYIDDDVAQSIITNNRVGFIGYKSTDTRTDIHIRIRSRFSFDGNESKDSKGKNNKDKGKDYFLYYMLEKVLAVNMMSLMTSSSKEDSVFDLMFLFFPKLLKEAVAQGLYKQYVHREYNDANVRGTIDINRHIRYNIPFNGRVAYRTREFSYDNPVTQLIRHTIEFIRRKPFGKAVLHNDPDTEGCVQQIIQATSAFQPRQKQSVINDNLRSFAHPYFTKYAALIKLCLAILRQEKLAYGQNKEQQVYGVLIDAAWLWEEYVAGVINSIGGNHYTRKNSGYKLFKEEDRDNKKFQKIIPDYLSPGNDEEKNDWVADAKYIPLNEEQNRQLSADRAGAIYYKTIMYMYRFNTDVGFLLHPVKPEEDASANVVTSLTYNIPGGRGGKLHKVGIVIPQPGNDMDYSAFKKEMQEKREKAFVNEIKRCGKEEAFVNEINAFLTTT